MPKYRVEGTRGAAGNIDLIVEKATSEAHAKNLFVKECRPDDPAKVVATLIEGEEPVRAEPEIDANLARLDRDLKAASATGTAPTVVPEPAVEPVPPESKVAPRGSTAKKPRGRPPGKKWSPKPKG